MNIYLQNVMDHFHNPECYGKLADYTHSFAIKNLSCGDKIQVYLRIQANKLEQVSFEAEGCAISVAAASMFLSEIQGMEVPKILLLDKQFILDLLEMDLSPMRLKCALLCMEAVKKAITWLPVGAWAAAAEATAAEATKATAAAKATAAEEASAPAMIIKFSGWVAVVDVKSHQYSNN